MKTFGGTVIFLDRDNINTDEIIPAKYLTEIDKAPLKLHLLEDLKIENFDPSSIKWDEYGCVISRANFGSGSSREMAPWAFEVNGINVIIATNFARIFRENMFNCGMLVIEQSEDVMDELFSIFSSLNHVVLEIDLDKSKIVIKSNEIIKEIQFKLNKFQEDLIRAGGWVKLAADKY